MNPNIPELQAEIRARTDDFEEWERELAEEGIDP